MIALQIDRYHERIRLPAPLSNEKTRLQRLARYALGDPLGRRLEELGVPRDEVICIRDIDVLVRARIDEPDAVLIDQIAAAIAGAVHEAGAGTTVRRYRSAQQVRFCALSGLLTGDLVDAWAWQQAGVCLDATRPSAPFELLRTHPAGIVALLHELAGQPSLLSRLIDRIAPEHWVTVARLALRAAGAGALADVLEPMAPDQAGAPAPSGLLPRQHAAEHKPTLAEQRAHHALQRSAIVAALRSSHALVPALVAPFATLALLETEPALLTAAGAAPGLAAARLGLPTLLGARAAVRRERDGVTTRPIDSPAHSDAPAAPAGTVDTLRRADRSASPRLRPRPAEPPSMHAQRPQAIRAAVVGSVQAPGGEISEAEAEPAAPVESAPAHTEFGGLLYLLHIVGDLALAHEIVADPLWLERSLAWVMHQLAMTLVPLQAGDPAALAFAGLTPADAPPTVDRAPPTAEEACALGLLASRIRSELCERVSVEGEDEADDAVFQRTVQRAASIAADPGWLVARFHLDAIDLKVRRAGLDRNPDYVPWLGVVVRFVYE